jgi:hypothetical protein
MLLTVVGFSVVIAVGSSLGVRRNMGARIRLQYWSWWERRWDERVRFWSRLLEGTHPALADFAIMELENGCERARAHAATCRERAAQAWLGDSSEASSPS